jgi:CYTH domain-containing protein
MKNVETERKFLVDRDKWLKLSRPAGIIYRQGYLSMDAEKVVRVRVAGDLGYLTIKGNSETLSRPEFEYAIPVSEAREMLELFAPSGISKTRTRIPAGNHTWEVDEFMGENEGLIIAEIELAGPEEPFEKPGWVAEEVTGDERYYNARLSLHPYRAWEKKEPPESP